MTNVRWSHDDRKLISVGGADTSIMVWSRDGAGEGNACGDSDDSDTDSEEEGEFIL